MLKIVQDLFWDKNLHAMLILLLWHWSKISVYHCKQAISPCRWLLGEGYRPTSTSILHLTSPRPILARVTPAKCQNANVVFSGIVTAPITARFPSSPTGFLWRL